MFSSTALIRAYRGILFPWKQNLLAHLVFSGKEACFSAKGSGAFCFAKRQGPKFTQGIFRTSCFLFCKKTGSEIHARYLSYQLLFVLQKDRVRNIIQNVYFAFVAQSVERSLGKTEVSGSIPDEGSVFGKQSAPTKNKKCQGTQVVNEGSL